MKVHIHVRKGGLRATTRGYTFVTTRAISYMCLFLYIRSKLLYELVGIYIMYILSEYCIVRLFSAFLKSIKYLLDSFRFPKEYIDIR